MIERARGGDEDAYEALLRLHESVAFRTAFLVVRSAADAEDVTQEAFVKAYRALHRFRRGHPFRPWLLRIVANEARNRVRASERRRSLAERAAETAPAASAPSAESEALAAERRAELFAAIERLSPEDRVAVVGRYILELDDDETAAALGVRRPAVRMRIWRALTRLRHELGEEPA